MSLCTIYKSYLNKMIARIINNILPIYFPYIGHKTNPRNGWYIAIWNNGDRRYKNNLHKTIKNIRITIRKNGVLKFVIKKGAV